MNTKKLAVIFSILLVTYFILQFSITFFKHGHHVTYVVKDNKNQITIDEVYTRNFKNERDNYYLTFKTDEIEFDLQLFNDFNKRNYIVKDARYYNGDKYKCIYPIFKDKKQYTDIICYDGTKYLSYSNISGSDKDLDSFVSKIKEYHPLNDDSSKVSSNNMEIYKDNLIKDHTLAIETYKGLYLVNKDELVSLFDNDVYEKDIHSFVGKYYLTADYDEQYNFKNMYLVNIVNGKKSEIQYQKNISFDSYIMGNIDDDVYLLDKSNHKQYLIDIKNKDISLNGEDKITMYDNGKIKDINIYEAINNNLVFNKYSIDQTKYERVDKVGNKLSGYYYLYEKKDNYYNIYRSNIQDKDKIYFITKVPTTENIIYIDDYIYFKDNDQIKYYQDSLGIKTIIKNSELKYNHSLIYGVFN